MDELCAAFCRERPWAASQGPPVVKKKNCALRVCTQAHGPHGVGRERGSPRDCMNVESSGGKRHARTARTFGGLGLHAVEAPTHHGGAALALQVHAHVLDARERAVAEGEAQEAEEHGAVVHVPHHLLHAAHAARVHGQLHHRVAFEAVRVVVG